MEIFLFSFTNIILCFLYCKYYIADNDLLVRSFGFQNYETFIIIVKSFTIFLKK